MLNFQGDLMPIKDCVLRWKILTPLSQTSILGKKGGGTSNWSKIQPTQTCVKLWLEVKVQNSILVQKTWAQIWNLYLNLNHLRLILSIGQLVMLYFPTNCQLFLKYIPLDQCFDSSKLIQNWEKISQFQGGGWVSSWKKCPNIWLY